MVWRCWGDGPPLVLLHGAFGSWLHWVGNIDGLARHFRVLAADMPGYGASAMPPEPYTAESLAEIMANGVRALFGDGQGVFVSGALVASGRVDASIEFGPQPSSAECATWNGIDVAASSTGLLLRYAWLVGASTALSTPAFTLSLTTSPASRSYSFTLSSHFSTRAK